MTEYDAVVVGTGPNGLTAAIELAGRGLGLHVVEAAADIGGGCRTADLTLPGFRHDVCAAVHALAPSSPAFTQYPLADHGLSWAYPEAAVGHPLDDGPPALLFPSVQETAVRLGADGDAYRKLLEPLVARSEAINEDFLRPLLRPPRHIGTAARFGPLALLPATWLARRFRTTRARALFAGLAAHATADLAAPATASVGLALAISAHATRWPAARSGSQSLVDALAGYLRSLGGTIETGRWLRSLEELPPARAHLMSVTPTAFATMAGEALTGRYADRMRRWRYGPAAFKLDYALSEPIPWRDAELATAGTVHLGGTLEEIAAAEAEVVRGGHPERPYVLLAQQSAFDATRAPEGQHTLWAYCHVPNGSDVDMSGRIEAQIERFAPGFRDTILARSVMAPADYEAYNPNYVGGEILGGAFSLGQVLGRPAYRPDPYRTPLDGVYLCGSSTPPGGGVHGMCGYHAARSALRHTFGLD